MNRVHRIVFNRAKGVCQAVSEVATAARGGVGGTSPATIELHRMSVLASACVMALAALAGGTAWANGGAGGAGTLAGATGGAGGTSASADGLNGATSTTGSGQNTVRAAGGGGGGGVIATGSTAGDGGAGGNGGRGATGQGASGGGGGQTAIRATTTYTATSAQTGGAGGNGFAASTTDGGGGGGGGGGAGIVSNTTSSTVTVKSVAVAGGKGGNGGAAGSGGNGGGGGGGQGGTGLLSSSGGKVTIESGGTVTGGAGGAGGAAAKGRGGNGGDGGIGVDITGSGTGRTLENSGTIAGGAGGVGGAANGTGGVAGLTGSGGVGLKASGAVTVTNSGIIRGGLGNGGGVAVQASGGVTITNSGTISGGNSAAAIQFSGGGNTLEIQAGSAITGNVVASSSDRLILGGAADGSFDANTIGAAAQYRNFGSFIKSGNSTWTLTNGTAATTPWTISGGTLSIASDSALGATSGVLTLNGGALRTTGATTTLARSVVVGTSGGTIDTSAGNTLTIGVQGVGGALSGAGRLTKQGEGTLVLASTDGRTGGTTIMAGTLQVGNGGTSGSLSGDVVNSGALVFDRSDALTYAGSVTGGGTLTQQGTGTLTLTGTHTSIGGTTISAGTLVVGNGGTAGSITGNVANGGALAFDRSDSVTFAGAIHGAGSVTQQGSGTLVLTGNSGYTGATTIAAGTLQIGNGGTTGSITSGVIHNSGTLAFNRLDDTTYAGQITGTGAVTKRGGTLTLIGDSNYTGSTTVNDGLLRVDGSLGNTAVTVRNGGALSGAGSIAGTVTVSDGGVLRGTAGQTLTTGALTFTGGSYLSVGLGTPGSQALFQVNGALTLDGQLYVTDLGGFGAGVYRLINYTGGLTNNGLDIVSAPAGSDLSVQTAVANQVNLVNTAGQELKFWDGASPSGFNNGAVDGGSGTWTANGSNWTNSGGTINSPRNAGFAVFEGPSGTVTVDNTQGAISVSGLQFASNGYVLDGGALTLAGTQAIIRVGDGTGTPVTAVVNNELTGGARLEKTDLGTLVLAGANSYTGGTLISGGTLQLGNGGTTGSIVGDVTNNGTLAFNRGDATTFGGTITGSGAVQQIGGGVLTLTADNDYTGGTAIASGSMLRLGNGGATGSIVGDVANNGSLVFDRGNALTLDGAISGGGSVSQVGSGTTTLTGTNTYAGGTTITAGTLVGSAASFGTGPIVDNAALEIRQPTDASFANAISGSGSLTKSGAGALNLTGDSSGFTGSTLVSAGTLAVNGKLGGTLTMASGTTLKGNGTVGSTVVQSGATVAPGNSIGLLNVAGNLTLAQGSTYQVEASADGRSDQIHATGAINLQGGTVSVLANGNWNPNSTFSILKADGGVNGAFGSATTNMAFLDPSLSYDANGATLTLKRNDVSFSSVGNTTNERASGAAVEGLGAGTLFDAVVQLDAATAASAFRQLTGEIHASVKSAAIEDSRFVRDASLDRVRQSFGGVAAPADLTAKNGVWARAFGAWGEMSSDGNASVADHSTRGILIGGDTQVGDDWRVGALGGYSRGNVDVHMLNASATSDSYHLGVYGGRQWGALGLRAGASYTDSSIDTSRVVSFTGFADAPTASYHARTAQAFGELGWRIDAGGGAAFEPFANLAYVNLRTDDFAEVGRAAALHAGSESTDTTFSTLGLRGSNNVEIGSMKASVHGMIGWRHAFGDVAKTASVALLAQPAFTVAGVPIARNAAVIEGGLDLALKPNLTLGLTYVGQFGDRVQDNGVRANLLWKF
ncbi:MAG: autotransporter domain-containing protein [Variovorax sp.]|nr:autotransporter domain-containing protein [Variovorax sp.]